MGPDRKIILGVFSDRIYLEGVKEKVDFIGSYSGISVGLIGNS